MSSPRQQLGLTGTEAVFHTWKSAIPLPSSFPGTQKSTQGFINLALLSMLAGAYIGLGFALCMIGAGQVGTPLDFTLWSGKVLCSGAAACQLGF